MNLLKITDRAGDTVYINPIQIIDICPLPDDGGSEITVVNGSFEVPESVDDVAMALRVL
jgi:hypothetical protein